MESKSKVVRFSIKQILTYPSSGTAPVTKNEEKEEEHDDDNVTINDHVKTHMIPLCKPYTDTKECTVIDDKGNFLTVNLPAFLCPSPTKNQNALVETFKFKGSMSGVSKNMHDTKTATINNVDIFPLPLPLTAKAWANLCPSCNVTINSDTPMDADELETHVDKALVDQIINENVVVKFYFMHDKITHIHKLYEHSVGVIASMSRQSIDDMYNRSMNDLMSLCFHHTKNTDFPELSVTSFRYMCGIIEDMAAKSGDSCMDDRVVKEHQKLAVLIYNEYLKIDALNEYASYVYREKIPTTLKHSLIHTGHMFSLKDDVMYTCKLAGFSDSLILDALEYLEEKKVIVTEMMQYEHRGKMGIYLAHIFEHQKCVVGFMCSIVEKRRLLVENVTSAISMRDSNSSLDSSDISITIEDSNSIVNLESSILKDGRDAIVKCPFMLDFDTYYEIYERKIINDLAWESDRETVVRNQISYYAWNRTRNQCAASYQYDHRKVCPISCKEDCRLTSDEALIVYVALNDPELNAEQRKVLMDIAHNAITILKGRGGTGKSFVLKYINDIYTRNTPLNMKQPYADLIAAALAAHVVEDTLRSKNIYARTFASYIKRGSKSNVNKLHRARVFVVEEASMTSLDLLYQMFLILYNKGENMIQKIILCGDEWQLPPVSGCGDPFREFIKVFLTQPLRRNMRNDSPTIFENADKIERGETNLKYDNNFVLVPMLKGNEALDVMSIIDSHDLVSTSVEDENETSETSGWNSLMVLATTRRLAYDVLNKSLFERFCMTHKRYNEMPRTNGKVDFHWYQNMKIYFTLNDADHCIQNGRVGFNISFIDAVPPDEEVKNMSVSWKEKWKNRSFLPVGWKVISYGDDILYSDQNLQRPPVIRFMYMDNPRGGHHLLQISGPGHYPLRKNTARPGYASTVHCAQGSESKYVIMVSAYTRFVNNQMLYTGITRSKEKIFMLSTKTDIEKIIKNPHVERRSEMRNMLISSCDVPMQSDLDELYQKVMSVGGIDNYIRDICGSDVVVKQTKHAFRQTLITDMHSQMVKSSASSKASVDDDGHPVDIRRQHIDSAMDNINNIIIKTATRRKYGLFHQNIQDTVRNLCKESLSKSTRATRYMGHKKGYTYNDTVIQQLIFLCDQHKQLTASGIPVANVRPSK